MLYWYSFTAIFIAWIWVDYYRLIDIYEKDSLKYFILTFILGAFSVAFVFGVNFFGLDASGFEMNGNVLNDFLYCVLRIGVIEELAKLLPFGIMFWFFRKQINEPVDYISYICISALGFSAAENILYFSNYGAQIISGRSILSTVGHMMFAAFTAYGIILYKYRRGKKGIVIVLFYFLLGATSHGIYDFWLMHKGALKWGYIVTILFFLESISLFAVILNNALNNSTFFTYKYVINSEKVSRRLLMYYVLVFFLQFALLSYEKGIRFSISSVGFDTYTTGIIVFVSCVRFSRYKLIEGRWYPLKLELPFQYRRIKLYANDTGTSRLVIKGEAYNEVYLNNFYQEYLWLCPLSKRKSYLTTAKMAFIEKKLFLKNDETYYLTRLYLDKTRSRSEYVLLKPKLTGKRFTENKSPIVALLRPKDLVDLKDATLSMKDFVFIEWAYPKSYKQWEQQ
jgi:RsiW-degrading membrane proteinase PrsW (M82 family)